MAIYCRGTTIKDLIEQAKTKVQEAIKEAKIALTSDAPLIEKVKALILGSAIGNTIQDKVTKEAAKTKLEELLADNVITEEQTREKIKEIMMVAMGITKAQV